jgi:hypothetical protein
MSNFPPSEGTPHGELVRETADAIERLKTYQDDSVDPRLVSFAHFLANYVGDEPIEPGALMMAMVYAMADLHNAGSGSNRDSVPSELIGLDDARVRWLFCESPTLAYHAFDKSFADAYVEELRQSVALSHSVPLPAQAQG